MNRPVRYDQLSSLAEVRAERQRLRQEHARLTQKLGQDCDQLSVVFSVDFWTGMLSRKVAQWAPPAQWAAWGYELMAWLMQRHRKRKTRKKNKKTKNPL